MVDCSNTHDNFDCWRFDFAYSVFYVTDAAAYFEIPMTIELYFKAKRAYYSGSPIMSDAEFDLLEASLSEQDPSILQAVGAPERGGKVQLPRPMGSLNQIKNASDFDRWKLRYRGSFVAMEKIDGNSLLLQYKKGRFVASYSRGDGLQGADNTRHTSLMSDIPKQIDANYTGTIRGEVVIAKADWETVKSKATAVTGKEYANSRNFTAGFMNGSTGIKALYPYFRFVAFDAYDYDAGKIAALEFLERQGFVIPEFKELSQEVTFEDVRELMGSLIANSKYELDGVVLEADAVGYKKDAIDPLDLNPKYAIKIKPESAGAVTTVTAVEWNVSKDGLLKPVVHFEPVQLTGVTISKATGHNAKNIFSNGIGVGARVVITRQGDVIPRVDRVLEAAEPVQPANSAWNDSGVELIALDSDMSLELSARRLEYFFSKLEVDHMGPANVRALMTTGVLNPEDAVLADEAAYASSIGANGVKAYKQLHEILQSVTAERLFAALDRFGRGVGERKLRALIAGIGLDNFLAGTYGVANIIAIDGFESKTAELIMENRESALDTYADIKSLVKFKAADSVAQGKLTGQVFCATGVRLDAATQQRIISQGGSVVDSLTSAVTTLVAKDPNASSSKLDKARSKGVRVISLQELGLIL